MAAGAGDPTTTPVALAQTWWSSTPRTRREEGGLILEVQTHKGFCRKTLQAPVGNLGKAFIPCAVFSRPGPSYSSAEARESKVPWDLYSLGCFWMQQMRAQRHWPPLFPLRCTQRRGLPWAWSRAQSPLLTRGVGMPQRSGRAHFMFVANLDCYVWMPRDMADADQLACRSSPDEPEPQKSLNDIPAALSKVCFAAVQMEDF